jgi:putative SOS response-associated peptidase YedK
MCGRVRLSDDYSEIKIAVKFDAAYPAPNIPASWNICPTDPMLVAVRSEDGKRIPQQMRWGLIPWWAKDAKIGFSSINARAETVDTAPAFRDAWKRGQRCLVVTNGFYEWKKSKKQPYAVAMADDDLMVMAGSGTNGKTARPASASGAARSSHARLMASSVRCMTACR